MSPQSQTTIHWRTTQRMCKDPENSRGAPGYHWPWGPHSRHACFSQGTQILARRRKTYHKRLEPSGYKRDNCTMVASSGCLTLLSDMSLLQLGRPLSGCCKVAEAAAPVTCCLQTPLTLHILPREVWPSLPTPTLPQQEEE